MILGALTIGKKTKTFMESFYRPQKLLVNRMTYVSGSEKSLHRRKHVMLMIFNPYGSTNGILIIKGINRILLIFLSRFLTYL
jgi:hypothetical protein